MPGILSRLRALGWARSTIRSLSMSLFLWVFGVIIVTFGVYAFLSIRYTSREWNETVYEYAHRFSELIQHSTHYSMLLNRKEDVHQIIRTIARSPSVEGVRIYDKNGVIIFSADTGEIGNRVDLQAEACVSCHKQEEPLQSVPVNSRVRIFTGSSGDRILGLINPIENARECYSAPCHAHSAETSVLGVLDVKMSMAEPDSRLAMARQQAVLGAIVTALLAGLFSVAFILRVVSKPVKGLIEGADRVAKGDLDTEIEVESHNEIGQLAAAFNSMTHNLSQAQDELTRWSERLEYELQEKTAELSHTQRQVAHMEKMASLGKLAATVAHELNNPLAGILTYAKLVERTLREGGAEVPEHEELSRYLSLIQKEADRSGVIVRNLLIFARRSGAELALHSLNQILDRAAMLIRHHSEMSGIRMEVEPLAGDDSLVCDGDQIQQALVALMVNAVEAMPAGGKLRVVASAENESISISVEDTGVGIPADALPRIYEPFFSSKEDSSGAGLGLAVVYGIIQRHRGKIDVDSKVGEGTRFDIVLPRRPATDSEEEEEDAPLSALKEPTS